jgi:hypothetical protein
VRQAGIWTRKCLRRRINMALGAPIAMHTASQVGADLRILAAGPDVLRLVLSVCVDAG